MATASVCGPCFAENKTLKATKFCSDCEERLCSSCTESHDRFKAFKSHHVIDLSSVDNKIPISVTKCCQIHTELLLDYFCTDHDIICCRACIPNDHRTCQNILPLEFASKNVKTSALYTDVMQEIKHLLAILNKFNDNRQSNLELLAKSKLAITNRISELKVQLLKQIDTLELDLHSTLSSFKLKHETKINNQKEEISQMLEILKSKENEIEVLKECGSNKQLFIALRKQVSDVQTAEDKVQQMISSSQEVDISLDEYKNVKMKCFGSLLENVKPCQILYKPLKFQQAQIMAEPTHRTLGFDKDPFAPFPAGKFNMDEFKRVYSNKDTLKVALPYFWNNFEKNNYSIWYCEYKYNSELTKIFMTCNLVGGFFQRVEKLRKNAFGSMCIFGKDNKNSIAGVWFWKGPKLAFELSPHWQIDYEYYEWKKLDPTTAETKKMVEEYWNWEGYFGGKKFNQGKIFK
ncbi:uncharacterized protein [Mytilus edulis]|uniref:uncharacterized protein n=1 Tax=Mytilus edulis TaxID=6550 RepID=UPI0039EF136F